MRRRGEGDEGQAAVELALVLPLVVVLLLAVVQVGLLVRDHVRLVHAAREAARQAAVDVTTDAPRRAAEASSGLDGRRLEVTVSGRGAAGSRVTVALRYHAGGQVPLIGAAVHHVTLEATATMRVEH